MENDPVLYAPIQLWCQKPDRKGGQHKRGRALPYGRASDTLRIDFMAEESEQNKSGFKTALVFSMLFAILAAILVFAYYATFRRPVTTLILIRHAEKIIDPNNTDVDLNADGHARAQELVRMFADAGITAIYATQYKRTQETVKPLADHLGLPINQVNAKNTGDLLAQIRAQHSGQTIFIACHNNTVPEIIAAAGGPQYPIIPESEYDNLYIVTVYRTGKAKVVKLKYGKPSLAGIGSGTMVP